MASMVLSGIGSSLGSSIIGGAIGQSLGAIAGGLIGQSMDQFLFSADRNAESFGHRLENINVQSARYGRPISVIYGTVKISGNIIWASALQEAQQVETRVSGGKLSRVKHHHTSYAYSISLAVAICEGPILGIERIWANSVALNMSRYQIRVYKGDEEQLPDPLIENAKGLNKTPAYRGLAYVVIQDLPLSEFGNRLPEFSFEVKSREDIQHVYTSLEDEIEEIVMIPGSGEFVYDTNIQSKLSGFINHGEWIESGAAVKLNSHNDLNKANSIVSLDQLQETLPNIKWVAPVVCWFTNSLTIKNSRILPGVEYQNSDIVVPEDWHVGFYKRATAYLISNTNGTINYGGTPSDGSVVRYFQELKKRNLHTMFLPIILVDTQEKPWRGRITGDVTDVKQFFNGQFGYNTFVLHYAKLLKGLVDVFIIGSELKALTQIKDSDNKFLAVQELIKLAEQVRTILGHNVKISYAADWSEYHHTEGGWYNLDDLWASKNIDFIGIDAYFPLTNTTDNAHLTIQSIKDGWNKAISDETDTPIPQWDIKNIKHWWSHRHFNPNNMKTAWIPRSKKIWFTELGFPSVDMATNQPNVFFDASSIESGFPKQSTGATDFEVQRKALIASLAKWKNSEIVEKKFIWTWDARPYPYWPLLKKIWSDSNNWPKGHWIQGKVGRSTVAKILIDLCIKSGLSVHDIDINALTENLDICVNGLVINNQQSIKKVIASLACYYDFFVIEDGERIAFKRNEHVIKHELQPSDLVPVYATNGTELVNIKRSADSSLPDKAVISYIDRLSNYKLKSQHCTRDNSYSNKTIYLDLAIMLNDAEALNIANRILHSAWHNRSYYSFMLPISYLHLSPGDLIAVVLHQVKHVIKITHIDIISNSCLKIRGISEEFEVTSTLRDYAIAQESTLNLYEYYNTKFVILDLPLLYGEKYLSEPRILIACCPEGENWHGCTIYYLDDKDGKYIECATINSASVMGIVTNKVEPYSDYFLDNKNEITVHIRHGQLESVKFDNFLSGANLALIGNELIQFHNATLIAPGRYLLTVLQRGLYGTEAHIYNHKHNEQFILLDHNITAIALPEKKINQVIDWLVLSKGAPMQEGTHHNMTFKSKNLVPLAPTHLKIKGNILSWNRRVRGGITWSDFQEMPMQEEKELYAVSFQYENSNKSETVIVDTAHFHLPESASQHNIIVRQISAKIGYGAEALLL